MNGNYLRTLVGGAICVAMLGCDASKVVTTTVGPPASEGGTPLAVMESCYTATGQLEPTVHIYFGYDAKGNRPTNSSDDKFLVPGTCTFENKWLSPTEVRVLLHAEKGDPKDPAFAARRYRYDRTSNTVVRVTDQGEVKLKVKRS